MVTEPAKSGQSPQTRCAGPGLKDEGRDIPDRGNRSWGSGGEGQQGRLQMQMEARCLGPSTH